MKMATTSTLIQRQLSLPGKTLPPALPLIISSQDSWNPDSNKLETDKLHPQSQSFQLVDEAVELLKTIDKPLAILAICGPYRSGKSYFISRVLGSPGAFKLGHSMQACTRGIWMATTVLECEQFATIVLDTEGIDAVGVSETFAMSLLTLTTLLSSFLIYNSKKVPQKVDLSKLKCFTQLSSSLLSQTGESPSGPAIKSAFPRFLWLLRDVSLKMTDRVGKEIEPTAFLHTRILSSESGELTDLGKSLVSVFPSLECATLPIPSTKRHVIRDIAQQQEKLKPAFNSAVDNLIQKIFHDITPKKVTDGSEYVNGSAFAALASGYVEAINKPGAVPDLAQGWKAVIRLELQEYSEKLVSEYRSEMEQSLKGNFPMEERNLMQIHQQIIKVKKILLEEKTNDVDPLHAADEAVELLRKFEKEIEQWNESKTGIVGGALFQFTTENQSTSKQHCEQIFSTLVRESKLETIVSEAILDSQPLDISEEVETIIQHYNSTAIGPATAEVMERGMTEIQQLRDTLKMIPGKPQNLKEIGIDIDRIKLSWDPPENNPEAVEFYVISKRIKGGKWEEVKRTEKTKALITDLRSNTEYDFEVRAENALLMSTEDEHCLRTRRTHISRACKIVEVSANLPMLLSFVDPLKFKLPEPGERKKKTLAALPASIILSPITVPVGTVYLTKLVLKRGQDKGDLTEE